MKRPVSEDLCRRLFTEDAGQEPSVAFWLLISQDTPCSSCALSRGTPASCRARIIRLVARPSLFPSIGLPPSRSHMFFSDLTVHPFHLHVMEASLQPPSACCLLKISCMIVSCSSGARIP